MKKSERSEGKGKKSKYTLQDSDDDDDDDDEYEDFSLESSNKSKRVTKKRSKSRKKQKSSKIPRKKSRGKANQTTQQFLDREENKRSAFVFESDQEMDQEEDKKKKSKKKANNNPTIDFFFKAKSSPSKQKDPEKVKNQPAAIDPFQFFKKSTNVNQIKPKRQNESSKKQKDEKQDEDDQIFIRTLKPDDDDDTISNKSKRSLRSNSNKKDLMMLPSSQRSFKSISTSRKKLSQKSKYLFSDDEQQQEEKEQKKVPSKSMVKEKKKQNLQHSPITQQMLLKLLSDEEGEEEQKKLVKNNSNLLKSTTFVFSGLFDIADREESIQFIKNLGGRVTGSVSKKTNYLVIGSHLQNDTRPVSATNKYKKAVELKIPILNQAEFEQKLRKLLKSPTFSLEACNDFLQNKPPTPKATIPAPVIKEIKPKEKGRPQQLWVQKYKPKISSHLVGNRGAINTLTSWLKNWDAVHIQKTKKNEAPAFKRGVNMREAYKINCKACLISGPPGIGKTSSATLIAKELGFDVNVTNASQQRNKKSVEFFIKTLSGSTTINSFFKPINKNNQMGLVSNSNPKKSVIIMDEVDGMGGSDRGGIQALIQVIKNTKTPIVCICNDRNHQKVRSLANSCFDIKFIRPSKDQILKRALQIIQIEENLKPGGRGRYNITSSDRIQVEKIIEASGCDIRSVINQIEFRSFREEGSGDNGKGNKDAVVMLSSFDAASRLVNQMSLRKYSIPQRLDFFFVDYNMIPLIIQDCYLRCFPSQNSYENYDKKKKSIKMSVEDATALAMSSQAISFSETINQEIMSNQNFSLLPVYGMFSSVLPPICKSYVKWKLSDQRGDDVQEEQQEFYGGFPNFPQWFGKHSKMSKKKRLILELRLALGDHAQSSDNDIINEYVPIILQNIMNKFSDSQSPSEEITQILESFGLNVDMMKQHLMDLQFTGRFKEQFEKDVGTNHKASLTREYNKKHKDQIAPKRGKGAAQKKKPVKKATTIQDEGFSEGEEQDDEDDDDESEDEEKLEKKRKQQQKIMKRLNMTEKDTKKKKVVNKKAKQQKPKKSKKGKAGKKLDEDQFLESDSLQISDFEDSDGDDDVYTKKKRPKSKNSKKSKY